MSNSALKIVPIDNDLDIPPQPKNMSGTEALIFGLTSAVGGAGVTSLAIEMAFQLARQKPSARTAIMSLDFENCSLAYYLDVEPKITTEHFCQSPQVMDFEQSLSWMSQTPFGFDTLALPISVDGNQRVQASSVIAFLDQMSQSYDYLILDIPRLWNAWTRASFGAADRLAMVCELNIPNIHLTRERCNVLVKSVDAMVGIEVFLNKFEKRTLRNSINFADAQKSFPTIPIHKIPMAREKMRDALNRGEPLGLTYKDAKPVKEISSVLTQWLVKTENREDTLYAI